MLIKLDKNGELVEIFLAVQKLMGLRLFLIFLRYEGVREEIGWTIVI